MLWKLNFIEDTHCWEPRDRIDDIFLEMRIFIFSMNNQNIFWQQSFIYYDI